MQSRKIYVTSIFVDDQDRAEKFYTEILGFQLEHNILLGAHRRLTVVSQEDPGGTELLLEPSDHPATKPFQKALFADNIAAHSFQLQNLDAEWKKLTERGVKFVTEPMDAGPI